MNDQSMFGLHFKPTIAMRRGEAYVAQCMGYGSLIAISESSGTRPLSDLAACPGCASKRWNLQHVPVGPFSTKSAHHQVDAAVALVKGGPANIRSSSARSGTRRCPRGSTRCGMPKPTLPVTPNLGDLKFLPEETDVPRPRDLVRGLRRVVELDRETSTGEAVLWVLC